MTSRKPAEVTAPVIPADQAFANVIVAAKDAAVVEAQKLESQRAARHGQYERDRARLDAAWAAEAASLEDQIGRQIIIQEGCDVALNVLREERASNVVPLKSSATQ